MHEDEARAAVLRKRAHVRKDHRVVRRVFQWHQNARVHQLHQLRAVCTSSQMLRLAMTTATTRASHATHRAFTNWPIFARSDVNFTSGNTAKLN
ncbi:hypothetical protein D3C83_66430 [compost metagenome]